MSPFFLPYAKQSICEEDIQAVARALKEEWITRGPLVQLFEQTIANYCDVPYAVAFNSGTAALMAAYFAACLTPFDRVISTPNTFIATIGAAIQAGIRPSFIDIDRSTGNLDLHQLGNYRNFRSTRGRLFIIPMHFSGMAIDMAQLNRYIYYPEVIIIEDAAHALGSIYPCGQKVGSCIFSHMTIFSFHPAKTLTTGEGGMVTTRDPELYHRLQLFRNNGIERSAPYLIQHAAPGYYEVQAITGNFNLTSFQAALGLSQFKRLNDFISKRRLLVKHYRQRLGQVPYLTLFTDKQDANTAFHLFVVQIDFAAYGRKREEIMQALNDKGIGSQVHYIPLYHHPILHMDNDIERINYPNMEIYYQQALSLPLYFDLEISDVDRICDDLISILQGCP
jgi:UDP-4-amino-4,6-dideoxy-L-N-acetyl-beta-L-altrosamine transaminase